MSPRVGVSGSYGGLNVGDEAILACMTAELRAAVPDLEIVVFSRNPEHTQLHHDVDRALDGRGAFRAALRDEVARLDLLLLGGGGILYDREAESYLRVAREAQDAGVPTATFAIGVGPLERQSERRAVRDVLGRMGTVTVRDPDSKHLLEEIGVEQEIVETADPSTLLDPLPFTREMLEAEGLGSERRLVGMSVRERGGAAAEVDEGDYHVLLANAADFVVDRFEADVVFVAMERDDLSEAHAVVARMGFPEHAWILRRDYAPRQVLGLMRHLDLAVGMRLHFLIFAAMSGVPIAALPYAGKVSSFVASMGVPQPRLVHREHAGALLASIDRLWDRRREARDALLERRDAARERARTTVSIVTGSLQREVRRHAAAPPS